jgi:hypothetical protein
MRYFILRGHEPVETDFTEWRTHDDHLVAETGNDAVMVTTMFHGKATHGRRPPHLFATEVHGGPRHGECRRYSTWDKAEKGHKAITARVFPQLVKPLRSVTSSILKKNVR